MHVRIHIGGVESSPEFRDWADRRVRSGLDRYSSRIHRVDVSITDVNGPKGGADKRCRCVVHLHRHPTVVVETWSDNLRELVDLVLRRVVLTIGRRLERGRRHRHEPDLAAVG